MSTVRLQDFILGTTGTASIQHLQETPYLAVCTALLNLSNAWKRKNPRQPWGLKGQRQHLVGGTVTYLGSCLSALWEMGKKKKCNSVKNAE